MKLRTIIAGIAAGMLAVGTAQAGESARRDLADQAREINALVNNDARKELALKRIHTETGVPLDRVQAMHREHPNQGVAGLMIACVLANDTKKSPEEFLKAHAEGKSWTAIARDNKVPLTRIDSRLERLEKALGLEQNNRSENRNENRNENNNNNRRVRGF